jgi:hypothetical protein
MAISINCWSFTGDNILSGVWFFQIGNHLESIVRSFKKIERGDTCRVTHTCLVPTVLLAGLLSKCATKAGASQVCARVRGNKDERRGAIDTAACVYCYGCLMSLVFEFGVC